MHPFEVYLNRKRLCVAGIGENGVLNTIINCIGRKGRGDDLFKHVGSLSCDGEHYFWNGDRRKLNVGDEVSAKIIETESVDEPHTKYPRPENISN